MDYENGQTTFAIYDELSDVILFTLLVEDKDISVVERIFKILYDEGTGICLIKIATPHTTHLL